MPCSLARSVRTHSAGIASPTARATLYAAAQRKLAEDVPALYLFAMPKLGVWDRRLTGLWQNEPIPSNVLTDVRWSD